MIARTTSGRFVPGTAAGAATRYGKGKSGNLKGRPKGRFRAGTRRAAALLDLKAPALMEAAIAQALAGDAVAARFCLGRILGTRRGQPVELAMKPVAAPADLSRAIAAVTGAVAKGTLTPDEALSLSRTLYGLPRVFAAIPPPFGKDREDPREALIREMDRLAAEYEAEERETAERATLRQAAALAATPAPARPLDVAVAEQQEQHQHEQQQPANAKTAAIAVTRIAPAAAAKQQ
jgi:hypothetical protein